jgi:cell division GTPase FtsZ
MAKLTAKEFQEKHNRRLKAATDDMRAGVERVTENPMAKAAKKADKMRANIVQSIDSGKWVSGLNRVTLDDWKSKMINKGVGRVAAGIDEAAAKVESFASELLPHIDRVKSDISKLPDVTLEDNIQRMTGFIRGMAKFKRSK